MDLQFWYLVLKIWSFGFRALLISWTSWKCYLEKEASIVWESDSLLWGEDNALLFMQGFSDWTEPLAQSVRVHCDLCTMIVGLSAFPSVRENWEQSLSDLSIVYPWLLLPLHSASHSCSIVLHWLASSPGTLWKLESPGMGQVIVECLPMVKERL